jgi:hypothetical protein
MAVYLLLCVPLVYVLVVAFTIPGQVWFAPGDYRYSVTPAVKGAIWFGPGIVVVLLSEAIVPLQFEPGALFLHHLLHEIGMPLAMGLLGALLFTARMRRESDIRIHVAMTAALAGFFTVAAVVDLLREARFLDLYTLVLLPTLRAIAVALAPMLITAWRREARGMRHVYLGILVITAPLLSVPGYLFSLNWNVASYLATTALVALGGAGYVLLFRTAFPMAVHHRRGDQPEPVPAAGPSPETGGDESAERSAEPADTTRDDGRV